MSANYVLFRKHEPWAVSLRRCYLFRSFVALIAEIVGNISWFSIKKCVFT